MPGTQYPGQARPVANKQRLQKFEKAYQDQVAALPLRCVTRPLAVRSNRSFYSADPRPRRRRVEQPVAGRSVNDEQQPAEFRRDAEQDQRVAE